MRAVASAAIPGIGAIGAVISYVISSTLVSLFSDGIGLNRVWTYVPTDAPNYYRGNSTNLATSSTICILSLVLAFYLHRENRKRARGERDYRLENKTPEELEQLGCRHPLFKYQL